MPSSRSCAVDLRATDRQGRQVGGAGGSMCRDPDSKRDARTHHDGQGTLLAFDDVSLAPIEQPAARLSGTWHPRAPMARLA